MEYRVLGPLEVRDGERSLPLAGAKQRALLALLLVLFAVVVKWLVIVGLVVFAVVGLAILLFDRR